MKALYTLQTASQISACMHEGVVYLIGGEIECESTILLCKQLRITDLAEICSSGQVFQVLLQTHGQDVVPGRVAG